MSNPENAVPLAIPYGTETASPNARVWAAAVLLLASLGLILLGGCFMIGVLILTTAPNAARWTVRHDVLMVVLYGLAFACFGSAAVLFVRTAAGLIKVLTR